MRKLLLLIILGAALLPLNGFGLYWNVSVEDLPIELLGTISSNSNVYSFVNIANLSASINYSDDLGLKFRLKDTFVLSPVYSNGSTNFLYPDRLSLYYNSDILNVLAGRDFFVENSGILIGNLADGIKLGANFFEMKEKLYVYYSGLLPKELNQFSFSLYDLTNGASRLYAGIVLEKLGFLTKSISLTALYSKDMTTNNLFNPFYIGLNSDGPITSFLSYNASVMMETGSYISNISLFGWGGNLGLLFLTGDTVKYGLSADFAVATGDDGSTSNTVERFRSFGRYYVDFVLVPDFSNLLSFKISGVLRLLNDSLTLKAGYNYLSRISTNDTLDLTYNTTGYFIGHEISGMAFWDFDPNLSIFLNAGYLFGGNARILKNDEVKVIGGASVRF